MPRAALRKHLYALAIASILPVAILTGIGLLVLFQQQRTDAERKALEITRALATAVDGELERSVSALQALAASNALDADDFRSFDAVSRRVLASQPQWLSINLATLEGEQLVNTRYAAGEPLPKVTEMESFATVIQTGKPSVGNLSQVRGRYAVAMRVPIVRDAKVRYVLSGIIDPASIMAIVTRQRVPENWVISVFDANGMRVARSRGHEQYLGTRPAPSLRAMIEGTAAEGTGTTTTLEGETVFTAYTRIPEDNWVVAMGLPASSVYLGGLRTVTIYGVAIALSLIIGLLLAYALARRINQPMAKLREAAHSLGRGEHAAVPETQIREIHEVGAAIANAAQRRAAIEAEREDLLHREQAARAEAESASRAKDNFLAMLGHELRNPLAALSNAASLLAHGRGNAEVATRAGDVVQRQVAHLARLTDDLLDAARALLGKIELRNTPVDLAKVTSQALATLAATGRTSRHQMRAELDEAWMEGDVVRLDQVVCNLLVNAVKYTPHGGSITVTTRRIGDEAVLTVSDDGVGMSPELQARAFELFMQGERGLDRAQGGLGIGLTLVRRLAELHGGSAALHSDGENRGSEFTVRFPAIEKPAAPPAPAAHHPGEASRSVLVVEDNDDARDTLHMLLTMMGHRVEAAADGVTGLEKALSMAPDIALVDLGLPGLDGYELAKRLRARGGRGIFLVAVTGYGGREDRERAIAAGFDAHMTKPLGSAELEELLANARSPESAD